MNSSDVTRLGFLACLAGLSWLDSSDSAADVSLAVSLLKGITFLVWCGVWTVLYRCMSYTQKREEEILMKSPRFLKSTSFPFLRRTQVCVHVSSSLSRRKDVPIGRQVSVSPLQIADQHQVSWFKNWTSPLVISSFVNQSSFDTCLSCLLVGKTWGGREASPRAQYVYWPTVHQSATPEKHQ